MRGIQCDERSERTAWALGVRFALFIFYLVPLVASLTGLLQEFVRVMTIRRAYGDTGCLQQCKRFNTFFSLTCTSLATLMYIAYNAFQVIDMLGATISRDLVATIVAWVEGTAATLGLVVMTHQVILWLELVSATEARHEGADSPRPDAA